MDITDFKIKLKHIENDLVFLLRRSAAKEDITFRGLDNLITVLERLWSDTEQSALIDDYDRAEAQVAIVRMLEQIKQGKVLKRQLGELIDSRKNISENYFLTENGHLKTN